MRSLKGLREEEGQAVLEWVLLMVPLTLLMLIPIELAQRRQARLVGEGAARYAVWDYAVNGGPTPSTSPAQGPGAIVDRYLKGIEAVAENVTADSMDSSVTLQSMETLMKLSRKLLRDGFLGLPSENSYKTTEVEVAYASELGGILGNLTSVMGGVGSDEQGDVYLTEIRSAAVGDPWFPGYQDGHKLDTDRAVEDIRERAWAIQGLGTLFDAVVTGKDVLRSTLGPLSYALINFYFGQKDHFNYEDRSGHKAWWDPYGSVLLDRVPEPD